MFIGQLPACNDVSNGEAKNAAHEIHETAAFYGSVFTGRVAR